MAKKAARKRVYKKGQPGSEYEYQSRPEQKRNRAARNKARREAEKEGRVTKGTKDNRSTQEVDHKIPLSKGGSSSKSNTRVVSRKANREKYNKTSCSKKGKK